MTELAERETPETAGFYGYIIIEWAAAQAGRFALPGWGCSIFDAVTGKPITTVDKIVIPAVTADVTGWVTCELNMFADDDGKPVLFAEPGTVNVFLDDDGNVRTGRFRFLVSEMRVRQP